MFPVKTFQTCVNFNFCSGENCRGLEAKSYIFWFMLLKNYTWCPCRKWLGEARVQIGRSERKGLQSSGWELIDGFTKSGSCEERKGSTHPDLYKSSLYLSFLSGTDGKEWVKVAQSCPTHCNPLDYTVHGILQTGILKWVAFPVSSGSSQPRDWTLVSLIAGGFFTSWATRDARM